MTIKDFMSGTRLPTYSPPTNKTFPTMMPLPSGGLQSRPLPVIDDSNNGNTRTPQLIITPQGGATAYPDKLSAILNSVLSGVALIKGANQIPTTVSGQSAPQYYPQQYPQQYADGSGIASSDGTASGKVENWVKNNTGVVLIALAIGGALMLKPPTRR